MGRIGIGSDAGDEWIGIEHRGRIRAEDGGYYPVASQQSNQCTCPNHKVKSRKEKPLTKKQIASDKKAVRALMKQIKEALYGPLYGERPKSRPSLKKKIRKTSKRK